MTSANSECGTIKMITEVAFTPFTIATVLVLLSLVYFAMRQRNLPPGPRGLPCLGIWPFHDNKTFHLKLNEMKDRYGDVFSFTFCGRLFINLGSVKALREAHINKADVFSDRWTDFSTMSSMFEYGLLYDTGESWKIQRKFFLLVFKERFMKIVSDSLSGPLHDIVRDTVLQLKSEKGQLINITELLTNKCTSVLRESLFGGEGITDEKIRELVKEYEIMVAGMSVLNTLFIGNFARYCILPFQSDYRKAAKAHRKMCNMLSEIIDEHKTTYNDNHARDIIDDYIKERNDRVRKGDADAQYFTDKALMGSLVQFVGDGVLAVSYFISIMIKFLVEYPDEQGKIYQEIVDVVGPNRLPSIEDKPKLPYLNGFIQEVFRMSDFFPVFAALECKEETTLRGYRIPKGSVTVMNSYSAHFDPDTYENPQKFDPSRFISKDGSRRAELPVTFGVGKRTCLGEGFTVTQIFLFLSAIVKNFHMKVPKNTESTLFDLLVSGNLKIYADSRAET